MPHLLKWGQHTNNTLPSSSDDWRVFKLIKFIQRSAGNFSIIFIIVCSYVLWVDKSVVLKIRKFTTFLANYCFCHIILWPHNAVSCWFAVEIDYFCRLFSNFTSLRHGQNCFRLKIFTALHMTSQNSFALLVFFNKFIQIDVLAADVKWYLNDIYAQEDFILLMHFQVYKQTTRNRQICRQIMAYESMVLCRLMIRLKMTSMSMML